MLIPSRRPSKRGMVIMKLSDIFKEGSDARKRFAQSYAVFAIVIIVLVLILLDLTTRG